MNPLIFYLSFFTFVIYCTVTARLDVNVALNRLSYSTSTHTNNVGTFSAKYGNDGDKSNCDPNVIPYSLVLTEQELNPWYVVDLGVALRVAGVNLTNRQDYGGT